MIMNAGCVAMYVLGNGYSYSYREISAVHTKDKACGSVDLLYVAAPIGYFAHITKPSYPITVMWYHAAIIRVW